MEDGVILNEERFRKIWQSGVYHCLDACSTQEKYIDFVRFYVEEYGKPLEEDVVMYRAVNDEYENEDSISGGSWTKSLKDALNICLRTPMDSIYCMTIPKGTKTIHFHGTLSTQESEDVLDTLKVKNNSLSLYAKLTGITINEKRVQVSGTFTKADGCNMPYTLNKKYSKYCISKWKGLYIAA